MSLYHYVYTLLTITWYRSHHHFTHIFMPMIKFLIFITYIMRNQILPTTLLYLLWIACLMLWVFYNFSSNIAALSQGVPGWWGLFNLIVGSRGLIRSSLCWCWWRRMINMRMTMMLLQLTLPQTSLIVTMITTSWRNYQVVVVFSDMNKALLIFFATFKKHS